MGRAPCCDKNNVKKGPWSPEEDAKLKEFIEKHGTGGNWIALPQKAGLRRCGKSCRLRWLNYLRPNIKHGEFTEHEDRVICSMYASIGSRWSIIASQLPGRTDNDIKNYWNTKLKKKLLGSSTVSAPPHHRAPRQHHHRPLNLMLQQHSSSSSSSLSLSTYNGGGGFFPDAGGSLHDPTIPALLTLPPPPQDFMLGSSPLAIPANSLLQQQQLHLNHLVKEESGGGSMIVFGSSDQQQSCSTSADNGCGDRLSQFGHGKELSFDGGYYGAFSMEHHDHNRSLLHQLHQEYHHHQSSAHHQGQAVDYNYDEIKQLLNMSSSTAAAATNLHGGGSQVHADVGGGMEGLGSSAQGKVTMM